MSGAGYILSGQKFIKNAKNFDEFLENLKLTVKWCYQKLSVLIGQKLVENSKIQKKNQMRHFE